MRDSKSELFTEKIRVGRRTYFFDVKENSHGDRYLVITESKATMHGPERYMRDRIMVFEEHVEEFVKTLTDVVGYFKKEKKEPLEKREEKIEKKEEENTPPTPSTPPPTEFR